MITAAQLRAARGLLDWTRTDLAKAASVSPETIKNIEHGTFRPQESTADAIVRAFQAHDVEFLENEGVRKSKELVKVFTGKQGFIDKLDHVFNVVSGGIKPVTRHLALTDSYAIDVAPEIIADYTKRMASVEGLDARCLIWEGDNNFPFEYCEYRWIKKKENIAYLPFYLYGHYASFMMQTTPDNFTTVSVSSEFLLKQLNEQFDSLWEKAIIPPRS